MKTETIKTAIAGIILLMLMVIVARQPEEPATINLTAEDCAQAKGKCYGP